MQEKRFTGRNLLVLILVVLLIVLVGVIAACNPRTLDPTGGSLATDAPVQTEAPDATEIPASPETTSSPGTAPEPEATAEAAPAATNPPAKAYLVVTVAGSMYEPIPLYEPGRYTVKRGDHVNIIEVTESSVWMAESSCDNQDCVEQGVVNLTNKYDRVLQNMVICLPNEVVLELYTRDELVSYLLGMIEEAEAVE